MNAIGFKMLLTKSEHLKLFFKRLQSAPNVENENEAYDLLVSILNAVEDEFSGAEYQADYHNHSERMYAPLADCR